MPRRLRILVLVADRSDPPVSGAKVRNHHLWPAVRDAGADVRVAGLDQHPRSELAEAGAFFPLDRDPLPQRAWNALSHSYHEWPASRALHAHVHAVVADWRPDVVHAEELRMAAYLPRRRGGGPPPALSVTSHNVESDLLRLAGSTHIRFGRRLIERRHLRSLLRFERERLTGADVAFAFSDADHRRYRELHPSVHWDVTRNGTDVRGVRPAPQVSAPRVLFVGTLSYVPNVRGVHWLLERVLPKLDAAVTVTIAGSGATPEVRALLARSPVRFVDTPADLRRLYAEHAVCVVPVLEGSGTRGKILEALAHERVVVSTAIGAAGLDLGPAEGVVIRDEPDAFAAEVVRLAHDAAEREAIARRGRAAVLARYDWSFVAEELLEAWRRCASR